MKGGTPKVYTKKQNKKTNKYLYKIIKIKKIKKPASKPNYLQLRLSMKANSEKFPISNEIFLSIKEGINETLL